MGGNAVVTNHSTKEMFYAEKVPLKSIGRAVFMKTVYDFLEDLNKAFIEFSASGACLWDEHELAVGDIFNGSTSFIMNSAYNDTEIEELKPFVGDIDVIVNKDLKQELYNFLWSIEGKELSPFVKYLGCNKPAFKPFMTQINTVFEIAFNISEVGEVKVNVQVDFEFVDYVNGLPSEWSKFGHSSSIDDAREHIKAVHHKYLLRALIGCLYTDPNGVIMSKGQVLDRPARVKIFNVDKGVVDQLQADGTDHGKTVYKQLVIKHCEGNKNLKDLFVTCFKTEPKEGEMEKLWSFVGLCELIKKYIPANILEDVNRRYSDLLWKAYPERTQELERGNPNLDLEIKKCGYDYFIDFFNLKELKHMIPFFYSGFGMYGSNYLAENFKVYIASKNYTHEDF